MNFTEPVLLMTSYVIFSQPTIPNPPDSFCCRNFMVEVLREHFPKLERFRKEGGNDVTQHGGGKVGFVVEFRMAQVC